MEKLTEYGVQNAVKLRLTPARKKKLLQQLLHARHATKQTEKYGTTNGRIFCYISKNEIVLIHLLFASRQKFISFHRVCVHCVPFAARHSHKYMIFVLIFNG